MADKQIARGESPEGEDEVVGRAKGGVARKESLSPERRSEIARNAALARHAEATRIPQATHEGMLKFGNVEIPCAVLEDGRRLLTQSGFMVALGRARQAKGRAYYDGDDNMPAFLNAKNLRQFISKDLEVSSSQIEFLTLQGKVAFGYPAELLPKVCGVFLDAEEADVLAHNQLHIARTAHVIIRSLAGVGIVGLVDEATGYQGVRPKDALQHYLEMLVRKELAAWAKKFPDEFYENIYQLRGWRWPGMKKNRYSVVAHYTKDLIYERLAPGLLKELENKNPIVEKGRRQSKHHQWLTEDIGDPMLAQHLHSIVMFQRLAIASGYGWNRFIRMVDQTMPKKGATLELPLIERQPSDN